MSTEVLIRAENVHKKFCRTLSRSLLYGVKDIVGEIAGRSDERELRIDEFWAVNGISFELKRGQCLGLIGPNGSGKSTLLKMLNGLLKPDKGKIEISGRVNALIELGAGFNPVLTGRENIYNNAAVLGIRKELIDRKFDNIVEFAEIGEFIDMPVQNYSSGMRVRLGFAVAVQMEPDILIIDEVLAVGDIGFRSKCYNKISEICERAAVIFVSHSMPQISRLASTTMLLNHGDNEFIGETNVAINKYYKLFDVVERTTRTGNGKARIEQIKMLNGENMETSTFDYGEPLIIMLSVISNVDIDYLTVDFCFFSIEDVAVAECNNFVCPHKISIKAHAQTELKISINELTLNPGLYNMKVFLMSKNMVEHFDGISYFAQIEVVGRTAIAGQQFKADWEIV